MMCSNCSSLMFFFFFNDTATTEIYTLSLHDALPILQVSLKADRLIRLCELVGPELCPRLDRKSTRLNSSHSQISYAVFCLKKKKKTLDQHPAVHSPTSHKSHPVSKSPDVRLESTPVI